jgi:hypothetical protein
MRGRAAVELILYRYAEPFRSQNAAVTASFFIALLPGYLT